MLKLSVTFIASLLHIIWYTLWSPGTKAVAMVTRFLTRLVKNDQNLSQFFSFVTNNEKKLFLSYEYE